MESSSLLQLATVLQSTVELLSGGHSDDVMYLYKTLMFEGIE